jgi:predicted ATPase
MVPAENREIKNMNTPAKPGSTSSHLARSKQVKLKGYLEGQRSSRCRIVLSGGPGGGKTTAADLFRREMGERVIVVPESATLLFSGGFPRSTVPEAVIAIQQAIFQLQQKLEDLQSILYPDRILLCDRGTVDGAAYFPGTPTKFFASLGTSLEEQLARYDGVIFFESASVGGMSIEGGNPVRNESMERAAELDGKLRELWQHHPKFVLVQHDSSFFKKITLGLVELDRMVREHAPQPRTKKGGSKRDSK